MSDAFAGPGTSPASAAGGPAADHGAPGPARPLTLSIDVGGTGLKASVLDAGGAMVADRVRIPTPYPLPPEKLVASLVKLVAPLPAAPRASIGFPGMVRDGLVLSAPAFSRPEGFGSDVDPDLVAAWSRFDLAGTMAEQLGLPTRVANDADIQGSAVVSGQGLELVCTLGTAFGSGLFYQGRLMPHLELAHQPFRKGETYSQQLGEATRKQIGEDRWNKRVLKAIANMEALFFYDHLYLGGGNSRRVKRHHLPGNVTIIDNSAGILGGLKLWDSDHLGVGHAEPGGGG